MADECDIANDRAQAELENRIAEFQWQLGHAVSAYIRARDAGQPCISCGRYHQGKVNAGHYRSRGAMAALRYHHDNIHLQCEPCNTSKSGNQLEYSIRLIQKIGVDRVEWLEGNHPAPHWKKDDYLRI